MTVTLAFYKGRGNSVFKRFQDGIIRNVTRGIYSHVELISGRALPGQSAVCLSASGRDGGVRAKRIHLKPKSWDLVALRIDPAKPERYIRDRIGARYDYKGILLSHVLALGRHSESRWFCSEICAAAIGIPEPQKVSPNRLYHWVTWGQSNV